jgi:hypothetical protein
VLLAKFTAGLLLPAFAGFIALQPLVAHKTRDAVLWRRIKWLSAGLLLASCAVYVIYMAFSWNTPVIRPFAVTSPDGQVMTVHALEPLRHFLEHHPAAAHLALPVLLYFRGVSSIFNSAARPTFVLGTHYSSGVWFYFPLLFALKMPPGFLLLLALVIALAGAQLLRTRRTMLVPRSKAIHLQVLLATLVVFVAAALLSHINIGLRHFSVPIAILLLAPALLPNLLKQLPWRRCGSLLYTSAAACVITCLVSTGLAFPYFIPYYNSFAGSRPKYYVAADSNLDWGQSFLAVQRFLKVHKIHRVALDAFGSVDHSLYVPSMVRWHCDVPGPLPHGWAAVSAGRLEAFDEPGHECVWLLRHQHWSLAGGSMFIFRLNGDTDHPSSAVVSLSDTRDKLVQHGAGGSDK